MRHLREPRDASVHSVQNPLEHPAGGVCECPLHPSVLCSLDSPDTATTTDPQTRCNAFLDPLIEHPPILLLLDLVLLKPRVFLHLLYNRGSEPLLAGSTSSDPPPKAGRRPRDALLWRDFARLVGVSILAETLIRLVREPQTPAGTLGHYSIGIRSMVGTLLYAVLELGAQLTMSTTLAVAALWIRGWRGRVDTMGSSGREPAISTTDPQLQQGRIPQDDTKETNGASRVDGRRLHFQ